MALTKYRIKVLALVAVLSLSIVLACAGTPPTAIPTSTPAPTSTPVPTPTRVPSKDVSFKVDARSEYRVNVPMTEGATFECQFQSDLDINLILIDPLGNNIANWSRVESLTIETVAEVTGVHTLVLDNSFSRLTSKAVSLTYRVVPSGGR